MNNRSIETDLAMAIRLLHVWTSWSGTPSTQPREARNDPLYPRHPNNLVGTYGTEGAMRAEIAKLLTKYPYVPVTESDT